MQAIYLDDQMSGWLIEGNTVVDAQMGIMVGGGRDVVVKGNRFIGCDKALHIDNRGMTGEKPDCLVPDMTSLKAAMGAPAWAKYALSASHFWTCLHCLWCTRTVWYGMAWHGMVWYGMVWYGMAWHGMVWHGMAWYGMDDMIWYELN